MTVGEFYLLFKSQLKDLYDTEEAEMVTVIAFEQVLNFRRIDISLRKENELEPVHEEKLKIVLKELLTGKPVQYVVGYSWFYGMKLRVNEHVLIPRPETEELVAAVLNDLKFSSLKAPVVLDICTGSGCIALAIKRELSKSNVVAIELSSKALLLAKENADEQKLPVSFIQMDALNITLNIQPDIVVSNPPYIPESEKELLNKRVKDFEPAMALFVPNENPLIFYKSIAQWSIKNLNPGGKLFLEIHEAFSEEIYTLLSHTGFDRVDRRKDLQGKFRMFRAIKS